MVPKFNRKTEIEITYDPYRMETTIKKNGRDIKDDGNFKKCKKFIDEKIPLQTWLKEIPTRQWNGFVNEFIDPKRSNNVKVVFYGRKIDFEDLKRSLEVQNQKREENARIKFEYEFKQVLDDAQIMANIDNVVKKLKEDWFKQLVEERNGTTLNQAYRALDDNYNMAKSSEFEVVFAGIYSSGKSTILNYLMRHNVLPVSSETCTKLRCRIKHDKNVGNNVRFRVWDDGRKIYDEIFKDDKRCLEQLEKLSAKKEIEVEIGVNLSHLYPKNITDDKFTIVLIDTPGVDSAQSQKGSENEHADTALKAINDKKMPMVIICAKANDYESTAIGNFMGNIIKRSQREKAGFKDRYIFMLNKSDCLTGDKELKDRKKTFIDYLTNPDKWGGIEDEIKEDAEKFVPNIFYTSAGVASAIELGVCDKKSDDIEPYLKSLLDAYRFFGFRYEDDDFSKKLPFIEQEDIPEYRKKEYIEQFEEARRNNDEKEALKIQSGMPAFENAIKDYIERYAFPIKVRSLLETFDGILKDVDSFNKSYLGTLEKVEKELGEKQKERKGEEQEKDQKKEQEKKLEEVKEKVQEQLKELNNIEFTKDRLEEIIYEFDENIDEDEIISFIRHNNRPVETGDKSRETVENEIEEMIDHIDTVFNNNLKNVNDNFANITEENNKRLRTIFDVLKIIVDEIKQSGILKDGSYNFENSITWNNIENICFDESVQNIYNNMIEYRVEHKIVNNDERDYLLKNGKWYQKIYAFVALKKTKVKTTITQGSYSTEEIKQLITKHVSAMEKMCENMKEEYEKLFENSKTTVENLVNDLLIEISKFKQDISSRNKYINELLKNEKKLNKEKDKYNDIICKIKSLKKIMGIVLEK